MNADGLQDIAEPPILGATAQLVRDPDGVAGNLDDVIVTTLVSTYLYSEFQSSYSLEPHYVIFGPPWTNPPVDGTFTAQDVGNDDYIDSDADPVTGRTPHFVFDGRWSFDCGLIGDYPVVNSPPSFTRGPDITVDENSGPYTQIGWATDISPGYPYESDQSVSFLVYVDYGEELFAVAPAISPDGTLTFTPAADMYGNAWIEVVLKDDGGTANGGNDVSCSQFLITVKPLDLPTFTKGPDITVTEDSGQFLQDDWATNITGPPFQVRSFEIESNSNPSLFGQRPTISSLGTLTFTPAANAFGTAAITVRLRDPFYDTVSLPQTFTITVNPINDAPGFTIGPDILVMENSGPFTQAAWATDITAGPDEDSQTVDFEVTGNSNSILFSVAPTISPEGTLTFTPATNAFGVATLTIRLKDDGGTDFGGSDISPTQSFTITVLPSVTAVGADAGGEPRVALYSAGGVLYREFLPYAADFRGGVRVAVGDVNGDTVPDIITAPGAGRAATIKVWNGTDGELLASFNALPASYQGGIYVAAGNFDADSAEEVVVGRGRDVGRVKIFDVDGGDASLLLGPLGNFVAYANGGVRVAAGDFDGLPGDEVIAGSAKGTGRVKVFGIDGLSQASFTAFADTSGGVFVAAADLDDDGFAEIIAGGTEAGAGTVKLHAGQTADFYDTFVAYPSSAEVRIGVADLDGDGKADAILTAPGAGVLSPLIQRFDALTLDLIDDFFAYGPNGGAFVAGH